MNPLNRRLGLVLLLMLIIPLAPVLAQGGTLEPIMIFPHEGPSAGAAISPDGARLLTYDRSDEMFIWDIAASVS